MNAATPPLRCASAITCWQSVVLPDDSGPKISVMRPRGTPPTPSARSRAIEPVGMVSTCCRSAEPRRMIEPDPNCFSMARMAASTARPRSATARPPFCSATAIVTLLCVRAPSSTQGLATPRERSAFVLLALVPARLALFADQLDVHRRFRERLHLRRSRAVLGLLLRFAVGSIPRAHRRFLRAGWTVSLGASRRLTRRFTGHCRILVRHGPARAGPEVGQRFLEPARGDCRPDPGHEIERERQVVQGREAIREELASPEEVRDVGPREAPA